ncbi:MAG: signal recognition particle-docking protein FtsY, partial [Marinobacter sp.]
MTAEWISIGLLALLVLFFVLDVAGNRKRIPRPKPVPQRKPDIAKGPAPILAAEKKADEPAADVAPEVPAEEPAVVEPDVAPAPEVKSQPEPEPE